MGKTTLGRALANGIGGTFIDGDDYADPDKPWYGSSLRTSSAIVQASLSTLDDAPAVVIAYPLRCTNWIYYRRKFTDAGVRTFFITLRASFASIMSEERGRRFDEAERKRIQTMIAEGYGDRSFSDLIVDTDRDSFANTVAHLVSETQRLI
ncbi:MAG: hypothetical protein JSS04_03560 [Proteobacteria bacterium]|nr:hypothetical protein [Pseudomonadota bacterium]